MSAGYELAVTEQLNMSVMSAGYELAVTEQLNSLLCQPVMN